MTDQEIIEWIRGTLIETRCAFPRELGNALLWLVRQQDMMEAKKEAPTTGARRPPFMSPQDIAEGDYGND